MYSLASVGFRCLNILNIGETAYGNIIDYGLSTVFNLMKWILYLTIYYIYTDPITFKAF